MLQKKYRTLTRVFGIAVFACLSACGGGGSGSENGSGGNTSPSITSEQYLRQGVNYVTFVSADTNWLNIAAIKNERQYIEAKNGTKIFFPGIPYGHNGISFVSAFDNERPWWPTNIVIDDATHAWAAKTGPWSYTTKSDGSVEISSDAYGGPFNYRFSGTDISGKLISDYVNANDLAKIPNTNVKTGSKFSVGAQLITADITQVADTFVLNGAMNNGGGGPSSLNAAITSTGSIGSISGYYVVKFLTYDNLKQTGTVSLIPSGGGLPIISNWHRTQVNGVDVVVFESTAWEVANLHFIVSMYSGELYWGYKQKAAPVSAPKASLILNDIAIGDLSSSLQLTTELPKSAAPVAAGNVRIHLAYANPTANGGLGVFLTQGATNLSVNFPSGRVLFTNQDAFGPWVDIPVDTAQPYLVVTFATDFGNVSIGACNQNHISLQPTLVTKGKEIWMWSDADNSCTTTEGFPLSY